MSAVDRRTTEACVVQMPVAGLVCLRSGVGIALSTVGRSPHFCTGVRRQKKPEPPCRQRELHKQLKPEWRTNSTCFLVMWFDDSAWLSQSIRQSLHRCCLWAPYRLISLRFKPEFSHDCWWTNLVSPMSWRSWLEKELPNPYPILSALLVQVSHSQHRGPSGVCPAVRNGQQSI